MYTTSKSALIFSNLFVLFGVLFWNWNPAEVLLLYWAESGVIGVSNVIKMLTFPAKNASQKFDKMYTTLFFIIHFSLFMGGHFVFLSMTVSALMQTHVTSMQLAVVDAAQLLQTTYIALAGLTLSHTVSLITNYFGKKEWRHTSIDMLMFAPYKRILAMHFTLLVGVFTMSKFHTTTALSAVFIILKMLADLAAHTKEHS